jgi:hypothetical protein
MRRGAHTIVGEILARYNDYSGRFSVPGEWGERAFRGWLVLDLLASYYRWPSAHILLGERLDILLLDHTIHPVVTIETKMPGYEAKPQEWHQFEARLAFYGTLRWAFLTNGGAWTRYELSSPQGRATVVGRASIDVAKDSPTQVEAFLNVCDSSQYIV